MKNLTKYIKESIFDIDDNIDKVSDVVTCKKWVDTFEITNDFKSSISEFISDLEKAGAKFTKKPISNTYMVYYKKMNDNSLYNWYIKFIIPNDKTSWKSALIGRTGRVLGRKIKYVYSDTTTSDISIIKRDIKKDGAYVLPEKYYKMIDIIRERSKYVKESVFDEEDIMSDIDNKAEILKWFKELTTNNIKDLEEAIPGFIKAIKKNKAKQVSSINKMDYDSNYIVINELEEKEGHSVRITIYFLKAGQNDHSWKSWRIRLSDNHIHDPVSKCVKLAYPADKLDFVWDTRNYYVNMKKIYTFPKEWEYIINLIEQNAGY